MRRSIGAVAISFTVVCHAAAQGRAAAPALTTQDHIDIEQLAARYAFLVDTCTAGGGRVREGAERLAFPVAGARVPEPLRLGAVRVAGPRRPTGRPDRAGGQVSVRGQDLVVSSS